MKNNKYVPLIVALLLGGVAFSFFKGCSSSKYTISYQEVKPVDMYTPSKVKLYIENSGSMTGYMFDGSEFKDAVYSYVSGLSTHCDTTELYFINTAIYQYTSNINNLIQTLNPKSFASTPGNHANTDLADLFKMILQQVEKNSVSVFVTDAILDMPTGMTAFFFTKQTEIQSVFENHLKKNPDFGIEIYRMSSKFTGNYYATGATVPLEEQNRPYYMFVLGDKQALASANGIVAKSKIQHGVLDYYAYSSYTQVPFCIHNKSDKENSGKFEVNVKKNSVPVIAKVDLSYTLHDEDILNNPAYYTIAFGDSLIKIQDFKELKAQPEYTQRITMLLPPKVKSGNVNIYFCPPPYPLWLEDSNDNTGEPSVANTMKTTGIKYVIEGISDAFASTCVNNPAYFTSDGKVFTPRFDNKPMPVLAGWSFNVQSKDK